MPRNVSGHAYDVPFRLVGAPVQVIDMDHKVILNLETGQLIKPGDKRATCFNPAYLRMPDGMAWQYVVVSRGPWLPEIVRWNDTLEDMRLETLVAFGANYNPVSDTLVPASPPVILPIRHMIGKGKCSYGDWITGSDDPRLFWSDARTPTLQFGHIALDNEHCRNLALILDLRDIWPDLRHILKSSKAIASWTPVGNATILELIRAKGNVDTEKNWAAFFHTAYPSSVHPTSIPSFHYGAAPQVVLYPSTATEESSVENNVVKFDEINVVNKDQITRHHPHYATHAFHHSTSLYRLTMCPRNTCAPTVENTVLFGLVHILVQRNEEALEYGRFPVTWNVTTPNEMLTIGAEFRFNGTTDRTYVFSLTMAVLPRTADGKLGAERLTPSHFFWDDDVLVSLGVKDSEMGVGHASVQELLRGSRLADDPAL
ncbi:hypothetical protein FRB96_006536 [Tulasnella sp. 330]|nr:hypothetical protein FRB96_006536 [Tulasnella sp. 330]